MSEQRSFSGTEARLLLRRAHTGTLATLNRDDGTPYASLVNIATDVQGWPLILVSTLAWHTKNLLANSHASLMVAEIPATGDALTGPRVTIMGRFEKVENQALTRRYLARHPHAEVYSGFGDFAFWRLAPERGHAVAGFGRIETMTADEIFPSCDELVEIEDGAIRHMNEDHADAVQLYAGHLLEMPTEDWKIQGIDIDGADLRRGDEVLRLSFDTPIRSADELRRGFAALSQRLRNGV